MNKQDLINKSNSFMSRLYDSFLTAPVQSLDVLNSSDTCIVIIDMINGFAKSGALYSDRIKAISNDVATLAKTAHSKSFNVIAFADSHTPSSTELGYYPQHCIKGTDEAQIIDELQGIKDITIIEKNSTNGFLEDKFQQWLITNSEIKNYIVVGCCTDICIEQFALTLKGYFNKNNKKSRIIVPINLVATYDSPTHNGDFTQMAALYTMNINGIEIVKNIKSI